MRDRLAPLAGDRLVDGSYQPVEIRQASQGRLWGHRDILNLGFCWEEGRLSWWARRRSAT